jgi:hypothetical protein
LYWTQNVLLCMVPVYLRHQIEWSGALI